MRKPTSSLTVLATKWKLSKPKDKEVEKVGWELGNRKMRRYYYL